MQQHVFTGQVHPKTSIVYEYPQAEGDPYYPVPKPENHELYLKYKALAESTTGVHFVGRLATYKYYNMDQVTAQALTVFRKLEGSRRTPMVSGRTMVLPSTLTPQVVTAADVVPSNSKKRRYGEEEVA